MDKTTCRWPGCERPPHARGFCTRDYQRAKSCGDFEAPWLIEKTPLKQCAWIDCVGRVSTKGYCAKHAYRARKLGYPPEPWLEWRPWPERLAERVCRWPDCQNPVRCQGLCSRDYFRAKSLRDFDSPWDTWNPERLCDWCGAAFRGYQVEKRFCSPPCSNASYAARYPERVAACSARLRAANPEGHRLKEQRRRARKAQTQVELFTQSDVRATRGDHCYLCGDLIDFSLRWPNPKSPSLDHVVPLSRGGSHTLGNVAMTCLVCNVKKGTKPAPATPVAIVPTQ